MATQLHGYCNYSWIMAIVIVLGTWHGNCSWNMAWHLLVEHGMVPTVVEMWHGNCTVNMARQLLMNMVWHGEATVSFGLDKLGGIGMDWPAVLRDYGQQTDKEGLEWSGQA